MPRTRALVHRNMLPIGYRNLTPSGGYPIHSDIKSKDKLTFLCDVCGNEILLSYDNINASPNRNPACQICFKANKILSKLQLAKINAFASYTLDKKSKYYHSHNPGFAINYRFNCSNGFHNDYLVEGIQVEQFVYNNKNRSALNCPECNKVKLKKFQQDVEDNNKIIAEKVIININKIFPSWVIYFIGKLKLNNNSSPSLRMYVLSIPIAANQIFEKNNILITNLPLQWNRLRLPIYCNAKVSEAKLAEIFQQSLNDIEKINAAAKQAKLCGAEILKTYAEPNAEIKVQYSNIFNVNSCIVTIKRANENAWGRKGLKQGEAFILICLKLMFPHITDWRTNRRDLFPEKKYEIDISSESLKLCVEYQGDDSHRNDKNTIIRDEYKIKHCPWTLVVIDKIKSYSCKNVKEACQIALITSHVKEHHIWNEFDQNKIQLEFNTIFPEIVNKTANQLKKAMLRANPNHIIISLEGEIVRAGKYDYICGICGSLINGARVKFHIDKPPKGCKNCRTNQLVKA